MRSRGVTVRYKRGKVIFASGDPSNTVLFIQEGRVKLTVHSREGKEALLNVLGPGDFVGVACLNGGSERIGSATAITNCTVVSLNVSTMWDALRNDRGFSERFVRYLLDRGHRVHEYLADQLLKSTEQRLARSLLRLAGRPEGKDILISGISHEMLAGMVGTTRPRVTHFMNRLRRLGLIEYDSSGVVIRPALAAFAQRD